MYNDIFQELTVFKKDRVADGLGGFVIDYVNSGTIMAGLVESRPNPFSIADKDEIAVNTRVILDGDVLEIDDIVRTEDGRSYRVTTPSNYYNIPSIATINISFAEVEIYHWNE